MMTYITAFIFYTMAMVGVLLVGLVVYKKTMLSPKGENKGMVKIIDSIAIAPKKMLLVVKVKDEKFLIASGAEHTTFLAKLNTEETPENPLQQKNDFEAQDIQKLKLDKIQNQFRQLYTTNEKPKNFIKQTQTMNKQEMVKALLNDLNKTTNTKIESRF